MVSGSWVPLLCRRLHFLRRLEYDLWRIRKKKRAGRSFVVLFFILCVCVCVIGSLEAIEPSNLCQESKDQNVIAYCAFTLLQTVTTTQIHNEYFITLGNVLKLSWFICCRLSICFFSLFLCYLSLPSLLFLSSCSLLTYLLYPSSPLPFFTLACLSYVIPFDSPLLPFSLYLSLLALSHLL